MGILTLLAEQERGELGEAVEEERERRRTGCATNLDTLPLPEPSGVTAHSSCAELGRAAPAEACQSLQSRIHQGGVMPELQEKQKQLGPAGLK
jgi:hypothetical protein